ncbi:hypothetical protein HDU99_005136, partial [Rhizoclosmatium hyalinum]
MIYTYTELTRNEINQLLDHLNAVHHVQSPVTKQYGTPRGFFAHHWEGDFEHSQDPRSCFAAFDSEHEMASSARVYARVMNFNGLTVPVGGIGDVATKVEHRGQGLAKKLLTMCEAYISDTLNYPLGVLGASDQGLPIYSKAGWTSIEMETHSLKIQAKDILIEDSSMSTQDISQPKHLRGPIPMILNKNHLCRPYKEPEAHSK